MSHDPDKGAVQETITWEPCSGLEGRGAVIESHWVGVNPHSPCPSLTQAGHKKALLPSPPSPR